MSAQSVSGFAVNAFADGARVVADSAAGRILWTAVSPTAAFLWLSAWMVVACVAFLTMPRVLEGH